MTNLSVIICAHNPKPAYLQRTLDSLRAQTLPMEQWELLLVDNKSVRPLAREWDLSWHPRARHVLEEQLGLSAARRCGMRAAAASTLLFVDDDNVLAPNYLAEGVEIGQRWPRLGTWGSAAIVPEFEAPPAGHLNALIYLLAIRVVAQPRWTNVFRIEACPWGAGMFLRKGVADGYCELSRGGRLQISGRRGSSLMSGDDIELSYVACGLGLGIAIFPELRVTHLIPRERVAEDYLLKLYYGIELSTRMLGYNWRNTKPSIPNDIVSRLSRFKKFITLRGINRKLHYIDIQVEREFFRMANSAHADCTHDGH